MAAYCKGCSSRSLQSIAQFIPTSLTTVVVQSCPTLQCHGRQQARLPCLTLSWSLIKLMPIELMTPSNHLILCWPLLLLPSVFPSIRVFSNESALHTRWPKYWSFSFSISPSNEYSRLISVRIDWLILLLSKGLSKESSSAHNLKASVLWHSTFFMIQLSHLYITTGKTIALTRWTFSSCF